MSANDTEKKSTVLIVDDQSANIHALANIIKKDYSIQTATGGVKALEIASGENPPDLILLDIMMPGMDGYDVCQQLKADERTRDIPIVFLSALTDVADKLKAFALGGNDYITKPFQQEEVMARVVTQLTMRKAQQQIETKNVQLQQEIQERKQAETDLLRRHRQLALLKQFGQLVSSSLELDQVLDTILQEVRELLNIVSTSIWLLTDDRRELECRQIIGAGSEQIKHARLPVEEGISGWVVDHGESAMIADLWEDPRHHTVMGKQGQDSPRSMISVPLKAQDTVTGVLNLVDPHVDHFTPEDLYFIESIAAEAAIAIENARLYSEVKEKNSQLQELNASKDTFFSIISHDLRSPFNALLGFSQILADNIEQYTPDKIQAYARNVHTSADRLYTLLENLLTWSRLQRGAMQYTPELLNLDESVEDNILLFQIKAEQKQIRLTYDISEGLAAYGDVSMVDTILRNLISNALKFTQAGDRITVASRIAGEWIEIAVSDTGQGIKPDALPKLFRIDEKYSTVGTAGEQGTGLGLLLCQNLVQLHGGRIWVESEMGKGTSFTFTIPRYTDVSSG
ncbi:MAG: response regulator [bacterium]|nr:response regulator [bacterium]